MSIGSQCMTLTISIHALREEGDVFCGFSIPWQKNFYPCPPRGGRHPLIKNLYLGEVISIHALREEGDRITVIQLYANISFLSTPSARRATAAAVPRSATAANFYPRPPRGGRRGGAPAALPLCYFYPRPPRGGRRRGGSSAPAGAGISIHALREEGDPTASRWTTMHSYFYPRPPRGGRRPLPTLVPRSR